MEYTRYELRCTYTEKERWESAAAKSGRKLAAWLRWLANTAAEGPIVEVAELGPAALENPFPQPKAEPVVAAPRFVVSCDRDWETGLPVVTVDGEDVAWEGEQSVPALREIYPSSVIAEIRRQLKGLN